MKKKTPKIKQAKTLRQCAKETLHHERDFINAIIQTTGGLIVGLDVEGRIQLFNHACEKTTGYKFSEVKARIFWEFLLIPEEREPVQKVFNAIKIGAFNAEMEFENYWVTREGKRRYIRWTNSALKGENREVQLIIGTGIDITERKEAEEALLQAEAQAQQRAAEFQALLEIAPVAVWIAHDPLCLNITGNRYADEIMRVRKWANISASARSGVAAVTYKVLRNGAEEMKPEELPAQVAAATGKPVAAEMLDLVFSDGRVAHMFMGATPLFDTNGRVRGSVAAGLDISPLKKAEEELRQSEKRYRLLVLHAPAGIYEVDFPSGRFTEVNDVMCTILGYTREELLAMRAFDVLDEEGKARFAARIGRAEFGDQPEEAVEYRVRTRDGRFIWALLNTAFRRNEGAFVGATVVAHDITERKRAEEEIRLHAEELKNANEELERFNRAMVARELQMIKLKKQVNELSARLGEPRQYELGFEEDDDTRRI